MAERAGDRVVRLLGLLTRTAAAGPQGVDMARLAEEFGVPIATVLADAELLWVSGTPGYGPEDLIDFDADGFERQRLVLREAQGMDRALRLGSREAAVLIAALRALDEAFGHALGEESRALVRSTLAELTRATDEAAAAVGLRLPADAPAPVTAAVAEALRRRRRLRIDYVTGADVSRVREVDPWALLTGDEHAYLRAWCHTAGDERLFRLDRVLSAEVLAEPVSTRAPGPPAPEEFRAGPDAATVRVELAHRARWVAEQLPAADSRDLPDGFAVTLEVASDAWLQHFLLRLAPDVRAVDPPGPADRAAGAARRALARYPEARG